MAEWAIEQLAKAHERAEFSCGRPPLDAFIRTVAGQHERRRLGRTYVAVLPGSPRVLGYYTLAAGSVAPETLPAEAARKLPAQPVPVILLGRLAVATEAQGKGLGVFLLMNALERCLAFSEQVGVHAVEVDAIDEPAVAFYAKYGFAALADDPRHLYLPMASIEGMFGD